VHLFLVFFVPRISNRAWPSLSNSWENAASLKVCWKPAICHLSVGRDLSNKEAQIRREKAKEKTPYLSILATNLRVEFLKRQSHLHEFLNPALNPAQTA
jgi:hypothetical protein